MFRTIRQRITWSILLPMLVALPLMGYLLANTLEGQVLIPQMATNLLENARLLSEITSAEYELWGDPLLFESLLSRIHLSSNIQVMFLDSQGRLLYTSDPLSRSAIGTILNLPGLPASLHGQETALTNYSILSLNNIYIDVYEPVTNISGGTIGVIRLNYSIGSIYELFSNLRRQILLSLGAGLLLSLILAAWFAYSVSHPILQVTQSINQLATSNNHQVIPEHGPEELQSLARSVNSLAAQLSSMESSRRQLLANIVHELGRPLGALRSAIHALGKGASADPTLLSDLTHGMEEETFRLQYLLDELANTYDKSLGSLELNISPTEMIPWLKSVLIPWKSAAQEKHLNWKEELPDETTLVLIDSVRMSQVIGNILSNAIKYSLSNGTILISAGKSSDKAWIKVQDSGLGIEADELPFIFQPFFRGGSPHRRIKQGMGLGLTIASDLIHAQGGEIVVESTPGEGSQFTITIPTKG